MEDKTFHRFLDLPVEIRCAIWCFAALAHRDVGNGFGAEASFILASPTPALAVLQASREARKATSRFFQHLAPGRLMNSARTLHILFESPPLPAPPRPPHPSTSEQPHRELLITNPSASQQAQREALITENQKPIGSTRFIFNPISDRFVFRLDISPAATAIAAINMRDVHPAITSICACILKIRLRRVCLDLAGMGQTKLRRRINVGLIVMNVMSAWALGETELQSVEFCCSKNKEEDVAKRREEARAGSDMRREVERAISQNVSRWYIETRLILFGSRGMRHGDWAALVKGRKVPVFSFVESGREEHSNCATSKCGEGKEEGELIPAENVQSYVTPAENLGRRRSRRKTV